jgi:hypothetical protein
LLLLAVLGQASLALFFGRSCAFGRRGIVQQWRSLSPLIRILTIFSALCFGIVFCSAAEVAFLSSVDQFVQFDVFVYWILSGKFVDLALGEPFADSLRLGQLDAHVAELPHLLPASHYCIKNMQLYPDWCPWVTEMKGGVFV